jgi:hypothetical protein
VLVGVEERAFCAVLVLISHRHEEVGLARGGEGATSWKFHCLPMNCVTEGLESIHAVTHIIFSPTTC